MTIAASYQSELLKTKRTASFWLSLLGAGFIPAIFMTAYLLKPDGAAKQMAAAPWNVHFMYGWQAMAAFLLPMYAILLCALVMQIEYKNNTWKQVYASPQTYGQVYFSKLLTVHTMMLFFFVSFNLFMIGGGVVAALVHKQFTFLEHSIDWKQLLKLNAKMYISTLGILSIQYWLSMRLKNFIAPVGIGLALLIGGIVATGFGWDHVYKIPFAHTNLTIMWMGKSAKAWLHPHEWNAIGYFVFFTLFGFVDMIKRKEKG